MRCDQNQCNAIEINTTQLKSTRNQQESNNASTERRDINQSTCGIQGITDHVYVLNVVACFNFLLNDFFFCGRICSLSFEEKKEICCHVGGRNNTRTKILFGFHRAK